MNAFGLLSYRQDIYFCANGTKNQDLLNEGGEGFRMAEINIFDLLHTEKKRTIFFLVTIATIYIAEHLFRKVMLQARAVNTKYIVHSQN